MKLKNIKNLWLVNLGEPLPFDGNRAHRMCSWKALLENEGHDLTFFTSDFEHQRKRWISCSPKGFVLLKSYISYSKNISLRRLVNHFIVAISLFRTFTIRANKPHVIIVSYPTIWTSLVSVIYGKLHGIKVVVDVRDKWPDIFIIHPLFICFIWPLCLIKKVIFKYADVVIAVSPDYYRWALPNTVYQSNYVLPLGHPSVKKVDRTLSVSKPIRLIFAGTLGSTYDLTAIISIYNNLISNNIPFIIDVCGDGPKKIWFEKQIKSKEHIIFHGWINKSELQDKMDNAHFGLMLYNSDAPQGWPNKLIEYMANGLPIVNTLRGESWDLIGQENLGLNCYPSDLNYLVDWIFELLQDESKYKGYVLRNYDLYSNRFNDNYIYNQLREIIL